MSSDGPVIHSYVRETAAGQCTLISTLVIALHKAGIMPKQVYIDALTRLWIDMPEEAALGEAGAAIERMLDLLDADKCAPVHFDQPQRRHPVSCAKAAADTDEVAA